MKEQPTILQNAYSDFLETIHYKKADLEVEELNEMINFIKYLPASFNFFQLPFFVLDYKNKDYKIFSKLIEMDMNYPPNSVLPTGLDFILDCYHKDDFTVMNKSIFTHVLGFLKSVPQTEHIKHLFSFTYRMRDGNKKYRTLLQKSKYITDRTTNLPIYCFGTVIDITPFKTDSSMVYSIDKYEESKAQESIQNIYTGNFFPDPEVALLGKREKEVLCWMAEGLLSKQIAVKMRITENTVSNHRKGLLRKTNTHTTAELIKYAVERKII